MALFVDRSECDGFETVVLKYAAAFYWLMWPTLALTVLASVIPSTTTNLLAGVAWLLLLALAIPYWPTIWRLKQQMRNAEVVASGSKYSFSQPLTYRWATNRKQESHS